ncbi:MAG: alpha/beta hydrolase domain-containing protein [Eubacteriales bacterium]|nr:alpha/beta hydrolase domain-containing protein [Eubacteriales bacterium]
MIRTIYPKERSAASHPFPTAVGKCGFEESGYIEEEYFFEGTSNVYAETGAHEKEIRYPDLPYCNRFLVRKPQNPEAFSGNVVVEILNATAGFDIDRMWIVGAKELMRDGAVYIGITSKPDVLDSLKQADAKRYEAINWKIPYKRPKSPYPVADPAAWPRREDCETGLFWDMLTDLVKILRNDPVLIPEGPKRWFYLTGWSQSATYLFTYLNYFAFSNPEEVLFDGYLTGGGIHSFLVPLNQNDYGKETDYQKNKIGYMPVPYIAVQTESENAAFGGLESRQEDSDEENRKYRCYEIAGATHDTKYSMLDYYNGDADLKKIGRMPEFSSIDDYPNDYPYQYQFYAIYRMLFRWVREGICPPYGNRIEVGDWKENRKDVFGNTLGGVRSPFVDVPAAVYYSYSTVKREEEPAGINLVFGHMEPFSARKLQKLYGTLENYRRLVEKAAKEQVESGFLLPEDQDACVAEAVERAVSYGFGEEKNERAEL